MRKSPLYCYLLSPSIMKTLLVIILSTLVSGLYAQNISFSTGLEKTVVGTELNVASGYVTKNNWSLGVFHQTKIMNAQMENTGNKPGSSWYGLYINAPLANTKKINVLFQLRTGLSEGKFIVVVPAVETHINLSNSISVSLGTSIRYTYPAFSLKTYVYPFKRRKR